MKGYTPDSPTRRFDAFSEDSPHRGIAIGILIFVGILIVGGVVLMFSVLGGDDGNQQQVPAASAPTATEPQTTEQPSQPSPVQTQPADSSATSTRPPTVTPTTPSTEDPAASDEADPTETPNETSDTSEPEPTEPSSGEPEPTTPPVVDEPISGDFGTLPESLLPSGGVSSQLELEYQLGMSLESLPDEATAYLIEWPVYSYDDVLASAEQLGFFGEPQELGVGIYSVDSDRGSLFVSPNEIVFRATSFSTSEEMPDDATAIDAAATWLVLSGFVGPDMDGGAVVDRDEGTATVVVKFRPVEPTPNLAPNPSATVNVGPGGDVIEARIHWPSDLFGSVYGLKDPLDIWAKVAGGFGFLEADITSVLATGLLTGTATITDFSISYTLAGQPTSSQYLVPLITFYGSARIDQTGDEIPVQVTVSAVYDQISSVG